MKSGDAFTGLEWDDDDIPAVIPKRLWDSLVYSQESIVRAGESSIGAVRRTIAAIRAGASVDDAQLAVLDKLMTEELANLATEKEDLHRLRSLLKWVPSANGGTTH
jgi:hypothetical protein